jgi:hypothetical protein
MRWFSAYHLLLFFFFKRWTFSPCAWLWFGVSTAEKGAIMGSGTSLIWSKILK